MTYSRFVMWAVVLGATVFIYCQTAADKTKSPCKWFAS